MGYSQGSCLIYLASTLVALGLSFFFWRWFLGITALERRVSALERESQIQKGPPPPVRPVPRTMSVLSGAPAVSLKDLPRELSFLRIRNGAPGLRNLDILANDLPFEVRNLVDGEERTVDLSTAMRPEGGNALTFNGDGAAGASAEVVIESE
jgi:hypothetical protein